MIGRVVRYRHEDASRNDRLILPDGRMASKVRRGELFAILNRLGIPSIDNAMPANELLDAYRARLESVRDDLFPREGHFSPEQMQAAAEFLAETTK